jgi:hypothetical protein
MKFINSCGIKQCINTAAGLVFANLKKFTKPVSTQTPRNYRRERTNQANIEYRFSEPVFLFQMSVNKSTNKRSQRKLFYFTLKEFE